MYKSPAEALPNILICTVTSLPLYGDNPPVIEDMREERFLFAVN